MSSISHYHCFAEGAAKAQELSDLLRVTQESTAGQEERHWGFLGSSPILKLLASNSVPILLIHTP